MNKQTLDEKIIAELKRSMPQLFKWRQITRAEYPAYIQSEEWASTASEKRREENYICESCGGRGWEVHHIEKNYTGCLTNGCGLYRSCESTADLELLCDRCHRIAHGK